MNDEEAPPYKMTEHNKAFQVLDGLGNVMMECRDRSSALHYIELLNRAFRSGYKVGYRQAKQ